MLNGIDISVASHMFNTWVKVEGKAVSVLNEAPCHEGIQGSGGVFLTLALDGHECTLVICHKHSSLEKRCDSLLKHNIEYILIFVNKGFNCCPQSYSLHMNNILNSNNSKTEHKIKFNLYEEYCYRLLLNVKIVVAILF